MIQYIKDNWQALLTTVVIVSILLGSIIFSAVVVRNALDDKTKGCEDNPRSCMSVGKLECLDAGGIFYWGGTFAADNCVFPPK